MKRLLFVMLVMTGLFMLTPSAQAHVLVTDQSGAEGAILHINPDDDPVAGQSSVLFFDAQNNLLNNSVVKLTIENQEGLKEVVDGKISGSLATIDYTFPVQGVYKLTFVVSSGQKDYTFVQDWRVARGDTASASGEPHYAWAEVLLLASGIGFGLLVILAINHRAGLKNYSKV